MNIQDEGKSTVQTFDWRCYFLLKGNARDLDTLALVLKHRLELIARYDAYRGGDRYWSDVGNEGLRIHQLQAQQNCNPIIPLRGNFLAGGILGSLFQ